MMSDIVDGIEKRRMVTSGLRVCWQRISRSLITLFLLHVTIGDGANAQETPSKTLLQIGISHSEVLPELPPNQQVGQIFDGFESQKTQVAVPRQQSAPPAKPPVQQSAKPPVVKPTPVRSVPIRIPAAWLNNNKSAMPPQPLKSTVKAMPPNVPSVSAKVPAPHRPSQAEINAAIQAYASQRNQHGLPPVQVSPPQSAMLQSQQGQIGNSVNGQSHGMLSGLASAGQSNSNLRKPSVNVKQPTEIRFKIPAWMAGVWQRSDSNELSRVSLPSGKQLKAAGHNVARVKDTFGTYRDESGQIWQVFDPRQVTGSIDRGPDIDYHSVTAYNIIWSGNDAPVVAVRATHVLVSKSTHRVVSSYQDEEMNTYSKTLDGKLRTDSSVKVFDAKGKPKLLTTALSTEVMVAPFTGPVRKTTQ